MGLLDKLLAVALGVAILGGAGALWYADHEHQQIAPLALKVQNAQTAAKQAAADRDVAVAAAKDAQMQLAAAELASSEAHATAAKAASDAAAARGKLAIAGKSPEVAKTLDTQLPRQVWDAIYKPTGD